MTPAEQLVHELATAGSWELTELRARARALTGWPALPDDGEAAIARERAAHEAADRDRGGGER
jgi:hypothetical protein